jgi:alcohol dehydrogenase class IV
VDPGTSVVEKGVAMLGQDECKGVIAIGGGSVLCAGKGIALVASNGGNLCQYEGLAKYKTPPLPLIAIPTTAGSGSEVSQVFIIGDESRNHYKMTIGGYECFPDVAILDPMLLRKLPPFQFIMSGLDALSHAIEATQTNMATLLTDTIAFEAIRLMMINLAPAAYTDDLEAKGAQLFASAMANIACGNAKLGLNHAVAQPLGSYHVAHGLSAGILLPYVMEFNLPACEEKMSRLAGILELTNSSMSQSAKAKSVLIAVQDLYTKLHFPDRLSEEMVPKEKIPEMAKMVAGRPQMAFIRRKASEKDVIAIYERAYQGWQNGPL